VDSAHVAGPGRVPIGSRPATGREAAWNQIDYSPMDPIEPRR